MSFTVGQRWLSAPEPELGLGTVESVDARRVRVFFDAADCRREYATETAPLRRVRFRTGDEVRDQEGQSFVVREVVEQAELIEYVDPSGRRITESDLSARVRFSRPESRLLAGHWDSSRRFDLRHETLQALERIRSSEVRGFLGGRVDLLPHQLFIADKIASSYRPRALLADEVGLGKTIEAGLILHRLLTIGRINRALILVPDALVHQWFFEMYRRFHLSFRIVDAPFCEGVHQDSPELNPFEQIQTAIASLDYVTKGPSVADAALSASWDMLVVDEAHHLVEGSAAYQLVQKLASRTEGLLLLTATPEQLGERNHFARLRLLDPDRYGSYEEFLDQAARYRRLARLVESIDQGGQDGQARLSASQSDSIESFVEGLAPERRDEVTRVLSDDNLDPSKRSSKLVDLYGPGRVLFRNTRRVLPEFPERQAKPARLAWPKRESGSHRSGLSEMGDPVELYDRLAREFITDARRESAQEESQEYAYEKDTRLVWLIQLLRRIRPEKVLLICRYAEKAEAIQDALRKHQILSGVFHEGLPLLQRDRNAAWFSEPEGAQILVCSELGSEGRNFQFAHHLVLFDLPMNPELLEQRIGRLDRIGQTDPISLHHPFLLGTGQEVLLRWYHEGLEAFERPLPAGAHFMKLAEQAYELGLQLLEREDLAALQGENPRLSQLVEASARFRVTTEEKLEAGRDRLLELSSFRPERGRELVELVQRWDADLGLDAYFERLLQFYDVEIEALGPRRFLLKQTNHQQLEELPGIRGEEEALVCDRAQAMKREELGFLTWDHPVMSSLMEHTISSERGNSAVAILQSRDPETLLLEALFVVSTVAPPRLNADRFLSPTPFRIVVDMKKGLLANPPDFDTLEDGRRVLSPETISEASGSIESMLDLARGRAAKLAATLRRERRERMERVLGTELERLTSLSALNDHVRPDEIQGLKAEMVELGAVIDDAQERLDSVRLIWRRRQ